MFLQNGTVSCEVVNAICWLEIFFLCAVWSLAFVVLFSTGISTLLNSPALFFAFSIVIHYKSLLPHVLLPAGVWTVGAGTQNITMPNAGNEKQTVSRD